MFELADITGGKQLRANLALVYSVQRDEFARGRCGVETGNQRQRKRQHMYSLLKTGRLARATYIPPGMTFELPLFYVWYVSHVSQEDPGQHSMAQRLCMSSATADA